MISAKDARENQSWRINKKLIEFLEEQIKIKVESSDEFYIDYCGEYGEFNLFVRRYLITCGYSLEKAGKGYKIKW